MKIAIVSSVRLAAATLADVVACDPENEVVWTTGVGTSAVVHCQRNRPDLVVFDMRDTVGDPVDCVRAIVEESGCAVLVATSIGRSHSRDVFRALSHGALDAVNVPVLEGGSDSSGALEMLEKIRRIARLIGCGAASRTRSRRRHSGDLVILGASAGGPHALSTVLAALPRELALPVVIVQHIDTQFADGLASWLSESSPAPVVVARDGERPRAGTVSLAGGDGHLILDAAGSFRTAHEPADVPYRPSIDVFCTSPGVEALEGGTAALLTGIGNDGARGLLRLRERGWRTLAQDQATSVVFGMPRAAVALGAIDEVLPLQAIGPAIALQCSRRMQES